MTEQTTKGKIGRQTGAGGTALAAAIVIAWAAEEMGVLMPGEVVAAMGAVIGWIGNTVSKAIGG